MVTAQVGDCVKVCFFGKVLGFKSKKQAKLAILCLHNKEITTRHGHLQWTRKPLTALLAQTLADQKHLG